MRSSLISLFAILAFNSSVFAQRTVPVSQPSSQPMVGYCDEDRGADLIQYCIIDDTLYGCAEGTCKGNAGKVCRGSPGYYICPPAPAGV
ncbi:hypothetical protein LZ554_003395 [Drepanopeziza brunnea f. sp. 'monogermtubi']|nr:hypothetical protein LZ554_003395 [Drepanopeziza brunnea f. sp. 'monogermtubi']